MRLALWRLALVLAVLWLAGLALGASGPIHVLLVAAILLAGGIVIDHRRRELGY